MKNLLFPMNLFGLLSFLILIPIFVQFVRIIISTKQKYRYYKITKYRLENREFKEEFDNDDKLQQLIQEFNLKRMQLNSEMSKSEKDGELLNKLDKAITELIEDGTVQQIVDKYIPSK